MTSTTHPGAPKRRRPGLKKILLIIASILLVLAVAALAFLLRPMSSGEGPPAENEQPVDMVVIGGGIMGVTLATYVQELQPDWQVHLFERLDQVGLESSDGWNNAGTGHSGYAEMNYTPEEADGSIATGKAVDIVGQFEIARQFWAHGVKEGRLPEPRQFINPTPHMAFVWGDENISYLKRRHDTLVRNPMFYGMEFTQDPAQIREWAPLIMEGRDPAQRVAATFMQLGTDVNFGVITRSLTQALTRSPNFHLELGHEVRGLHQNADETWNVTVHDLATGTDRTIKTRFVFIGAGGASLKLLQASGIPESKNYAGFPVGGQFLSFRSPELTARHDVKVYGKAEAGSPPMSVPHLDARRLDGQDVMLFGPFALQSTKFLKQGSWWDLFSSIYDSNIMPMMDVGAENLDLVRYLGEQATLTDEQRQAELVKYFPNARRQDWKLVTAGQRVQIIKKDPEKGGVLQFGTEIVSDKDGTIAALLGASPGASTSPAIMLEVLRRAFPQQMAGPWRAQIQQMIPSYGQDINGSADMTNRIRRMTSQALNLPYIEVPQSVAAPASAPPADSSQHRQLLTPGSAGRPEVPPASNRENRELQAL